MSAPACLRASAHVHVLPRELLRVRMLASVRACARACVQVGAPARACQQLIVRAVRFCTVDDLLLLEVVRMSVRHGKPGRFSRSGVGLGNVVRWVRGLWGFAGHCGSARVCVLPGQHRCMKLSALGPMFGGTKRHSIDCARKIAASFGTKNLNPTEPYRLHVSMPR